MKAQTPLSSPHGRPGRRWLAASGLSPADMDRPLLGVAVSLTDSLGLSPSAEILLQNIEKGLRLAGACPFRLNLSGVAPELAESRDGAFYRLPRRDLLADQLECLASQAGLDGLVLAADQNETAAGLLMGAARLNLPAVFVPALGSAPRPSTPAPRPDGRVEYPERMASCLAEVMGLSFPLASTAPTGSPEQFNLAFLAAQRAVELARQNFGVRRVLMGNAFMNAVRADAAVGGWPEAVLFLSALAKEAGVRLTLENFEEIGRKTPQVCRLWGPKGHDLLDLHQAGGWPALFSALKGSWQPHPTVSGRGVTDLSRNGHAKDPHVVRPRAPYRPEGGMLVLRGNLAPQGALLQWPQDAKPAPLAGPVRVFESLETALESAAKKQIKKGDVVVVRQEGPKSGSGLRPLAPLGRMLAAQGLARQVALVTDGAWGAPMDAVSVEMISPEAAQGAPLSVLKDGDRVEINPLTRRLTVYATDMDLKVRLARWKAPAPRAANGFLARYARSVGPALEGATLK